jgi:hypothetical protein
VRKSHQLHCVSIRLTPHHSSFSTTLTLFLFDRSLKTQEMQDDEVEDNGVVVSNDDRLQDNMDLMFSKEEKKSTPAVARVSPDATDAVGAAPLPTVEQRQKRPRLSFEPVPPPPSTLSAEALAQSFLTCPDGYTYVP